MAAEKPTYEELLARCERAEAMRSRTERIAHMGSWEWDVESDTVTWSNELFRIFGREPGGRAPSFAEHPDLYVAEDMERLRGAVTRCVKAGTPYELELRAKRADGEIRHCIARGQPETDVRGRVYRLVGSFQDITERKRAQKEMESLFSLSLAMICIADIQTATFTRVNPAFTDILGYEAEELLSRPFVDFVHPDDVEPTRRILEDRLQRGEKVIHFENRYRHKDGSFRWISWVSHPRLEEGLAYAVAIDVTEKKRAEADLRESEERFRTLIENLPAGTFLHDLDGTFRMVNAAACKNTGYSRDELLGMSVAHIDPESFSRDDRKGLWKRLRTGESATFESTHVRKDGSRYPAELHLNGIVLDGEPVILPVAFDITERRQAEKALRESETLLEETGRMARVGGWEVDARTRELTWTTETYRIHEVPLDRKPPFEEAIEFFHPDDRPKLTEAVGRALEEGEGYDMELRFITAKGRELITRTRCTPIVEDGEVVKLRGTFQDITAQKEMQDRLSQMEKMDAIGQLAGGVAHDFNNQLAGIMGFADMLAHRLEDPRLRKYAENIVAASKRSSDLTQQLLAFARKGQYKKEPLDLHKTVHDVVTILEHTIDPRITTRQLLCASPAVTTGDPSQLQNVVLNLAINARDAMPEGGELIFETANTRLERDYCDAVPYDIAPGHYVRLCVTDSGVGMDAETQAHVFEPFFTTKDVGKGTGMGLAAVYGTVKNHGGSVNVYSEPGRGTSFRVYLPLEEDAARELGPPPAAAPLSAKPLRILVVDDEEIFRNMACEMLRDAGHRVDTAADGTAAVEHYRRRWRETDLVILDMVMPQMDGKEAFRRMKEIDPAVRVLLASGYSINGTANELLAEGVHGFLQKPFSQAELDQAVEIEGQIP